MVQSLIPPSQDGQKPEERSAQKVARESEEKWDMSLANSIISDCELDSLDLSPRPLLINPWARQGDLGFVFAARGVGKTWIGIYVAHCLADSKDFGPWKVPPNDSKILYMDGEMAIADVQYRNRVLGAGRSNLFYLSHEILFERSNRIINLINRELQEAVIKFCKDQAFNVLILDNLSCLAAGMEENSALDWEKILPWLLCLRREKISVIFIHHAGREGLHMRGTSKREDPAAWIIHLRAPKNDPDHEVQGAHFISSFDKFRNCQSRPKDIEWNFSPLDNGKEMIVRCEECNPLDVFLEMVKDGVDQCSRIAEDMDLSEATICRLARKCEEKGLIEIKNRRYYIKTSQPRTYNPSDD